MNDLTSAIVAWDRSTFLAINHGLKCSFLDRVMPAITDIGLGHIQAVIVIGLAFWLGIRAQEVRRGSALRDLRAVVYARRAWVAPLLLSFALSGLVADTIKVIPRERPWWYYENEHRAGRNLDVTVYTVPGTYPLKARGFPSGHTATTVAMAVVLTLLYVRRRQDLRLGLGVWGLAAIVAISRIYLGSHWPLDVLGGALIGAMTGWLSLRICRLWAVRAMREVTAKEAVNMTPEAAQSPSLARSNNVPERESRI